MYMNCAVVTIGGATPRKLAKRQLDGPNMFLANIGNGCSTPGATDLVFPDPGVDVEYNGDESKRANPIGNCGPVAYTPPPPPPPGSPDTGVDNGGDNGLGQGDFGGGDMGPVDPGVGGDFGGNTGMNNDPLSTPGNENILDEQRGDCPYWMAQGYVCSDATTVTTALTQGVSRFFSLHFVFPVLVSLGFGLFR